MRLYREHTSKEQIKDLEVLGRDLDKVIIIDNIAKSFEKQPRNGIVIKTWLGDPKDTALGAMIEPLSRIFLDRQTNLYEIVALINSYSKY